MYWLISMNAIVNYINQYTSNHHGHQHSDSITTEASSYDDRSHVKLSLSLICLTIYCMMTSLQHYLFMALTLALHPL